MINSNNTDYRPGHLTWSCIINVMKSLCLKFAKKSLRVDNFGHLFPVSKKKHLMKTRGGDVYRVSKGFSERFCKSAIPYLQRLLNKDKKKQLKELKRSTLSPTNLSIADNAVVE